ncbi:hypothetical protein SCHPADRAFT_900330 [Schizopora paradoxa]|uniref:Fe2OG dioxygenase domain-containing protein n=1 Tax=Schizopora paradoxa TaxID=27342 RepID=A0A0H2S1N8_9AGAM|nr:hypothetical protein SCHPADRAFT_900330 [Schizopora paradoxa]
MSFEMLDDFLVDSGDLKSVHYIPNFVSEEEEEYIIRQINNAPKPKWKTLPNRRLQVWGGEITKSGKLLKQPLPAFLNKFPDIISRLRGLGVFKDSKIGQPNHVIVNEYLPGQGIMPHEDGPRYHPVVCTISLGSHTVVNYYRYLAQEKQSSPESVKEGVESASDGKPGAPRPIDTKPVLSVLLEPRSLVITSSELYAQHLHGISPVVEDKFTALNSEDDALEDETGEADSNSNEDRILVANAALLGGANEREAVLKGSVLERSTRISLTCRSVEQVSTLSASKLLSY